MLQFHERPVTTVMMKSLIFFDGRTIMVVEKVFKIDEVIDESGLKISSVFAKFYFDIENRILPMWFELNKFRKEVLIYWIAYYFSEKVVEATRLINGLEFVNCPFVLQKLCLPPFNEE